jgi:serine protease inhibitor
LSNDKQQNGRIPYGIWGEGFLVLPKFKIENNFKLNSTLQALGIKAAFKANQADFSGMFNDPHYLSKVRQKTFVEVNETGTEAAAVTVASGAYGSVVSPPKPFEMIVNRPFLFAITDAQSGMILFMGIMNDL